MFCDDCLTTAKEKLSYGNTYRISPAMNELITRIA